LGFGKIRPEIKSKQRDIAAKVLPPQIAELFQKTEFPFMQAVTDNLTAKNVFMNGKVLLVGDAAAGLRPHVAAGTTQAAMHSLLLGRVFAKNDFMSLAEWEKMTLYFGTEGGRFNGNCESIW
jgi:2-polyprenyl-6-methoxyphenol hydroxylase-like FAD-dependent oxidoreductase